MAEPAKDKIIKALQVAEGLYHRLVLLVGKSGSGKTQILRSVADALGTEVININFSLSAALLDLTAKQRALRLPEILAQMTEKGQATAVLDNLEILFDNELKQDPLRLLQGLSRNRPIIASWNGCTEGGKLIYAAADHAEYRSYSTNDLLTVDATKM